MTEEKRSVANGQPVVTRKPRATAPAAGGDSWRDNPWAYVCRQCEGDGCQYCDGTGHIDEPEFDLDGYDYTGGGR